MNLYQMISMAQGGQAMANLGRQFGLDEKQSEEALRHLLPAFSTGLKRNTQTMDGLSALLAALNGGHHARYYEDSSIFGEASVLADGNDILGHMFGSKDISRAVAARAAEQTGIGAEILKAMLPYIASMIMGALFKQGQNPIGDILGEVLGGGRGQAGRQPQSPFDTGNNPFGSGDNPFGPLSEILKQGAGEQGTGQTGRPIPKSGADIFGQMFDADGDGSAMDDIFDILMKGSGR